MSFVLDNSVAMRWLLGGTAIEVTYASMVLEALKTTSAVVPGLWYLEASNVIAKAENKRVVLEARSKHFIATLNALNILADPDTTRHALGDTLNLARRYRLSSYDAAYLELALRNGLPVATLDKDLEIAAAKAGVPKFEGA